MEALRALADVRQHHERISEHERMHLPEASSVRFVLLLQGPVGGFFGALKRGFEAAGWRVLKLNFNAGDCLFDQGPHSLPYNASCERFEHWLNELCRHDPPDCIILFGDRRPLHEAACCVAHHWGVPVWCFEEGYIRPGYVTLEAGGNNARSPLLSSPAQDLGGVAAQPQTAALVRSRFMAMALRATAYYLAMAAGRFRFPHYNHHRRRSIPAEIRLWSASFARKAIRLRRNRRLTHRILTEGRDRFFLLACQVPDDLQLVHHGRGWLVQNTMEAVIRSFARSAPRDRFLVIKAHALARGHLDHTELAASLALEYECQDRVAVVEDGPITPLIKASLGLITVNSTSGLTALYHGRPVAVLGEAFYASAGLAWQIGEAELDHFWNAPPAPDLDRCQALRSGMIRDSLIPGSFYQSDTWPSLIDMAVRRISNATPVPAGAAQAFSVPSQAAFLHELGACWQDARDPAHE